MRDLRGACQRNSSFGRGKHRIRLAIKRSTGRARTHSIKEKRPICWKLRLSGIKEAGSLKVTQQNSKPQQRIPERFSAKFSIFHNKSANFSCPVFSQKSQFFTGWVVFAHFPRKNGGFQIGSRLAKLSPIRKRRNPNFCACKSCTFPVPTRCCGMMEVRRNGACPLSFIPLRNR